MNISFNNSFNYYNTAIAQYNSYAPITNTLQRSPSEDCFIKNDSGISNPIFTGSKKATKAEKKEIKTYENMLKNIDGLHDPYSDVIMISQRKYNNLVGKIHKRGNAESMNNLMEDYKKHMFPSELEVFYLLKYETTKAKKKGNISNLTYSDILKSYLPLAKARLVNNQLDVTDSIRDYSIHNLNKKQQKDVETYLTVIEKDIYADRFRIKYSIDLLRRLYDDIPDKSKVDKIIRLSHNFPNTATSSDAFIVKYADKKQDEIAEFLVSPAKISIEHIKPQSTNGEDKGDNYLAASTRMNNYRSSTPLDEVIERYPKIPHQTQRYIDDLITRINRGGLTDIAYTLPGVKESLEAESKGLIKIDLSRLNPSIREKVDEFHERINCLVEKFNGKD